MPYTDVARSNLADDQNYDISEEGHVAEYGLKRDAVKREYDDANA